MLAWARRAARFVTIDQYDRIDEDHRREPFDRRAIWVLLAIALSMLMSRYFGRASWVAKQGWAQQLFAELPLYPRIWPRLYWAMFKLVNYGLVAVLVIKLVYRERVRDFGFAGKTDRRLWLVYLGLFAIVVPVVYLVSSMPEFLATYPKYRHAGRSLTDLLVWEAAYGVQFLMLEMFFRGFILFALARYCGHIAIFIMVVPYTMIHFGKPLPEALGSIVAGVALGTLALRTRSIFGGVAIHCAVAWCMDLFAMHRTGHLDRLLRSLG
jgi:membrane protease YdiL (CAAX protease family)